MMHATSESDVTSIAPSSSSPAAYYVQSPSSESHDEMDKCSSSLESPCTYPRHSMASSSSTAASRISGNRQRWNKHYCNAVDEEAEAGYDDDDGTDGDNLLQCRCLIFVVAFGMLFAGICLVVWGASSPYKPQVSIKGLIVQNLYFGEGSDHTGVPTKLITVNCSANLAIHNPATFFGIDISSRSVYLMYSQIAVASGQVNKYFQPRKSTRVMWVRLVGQGVPLYGAGIALVASDDESGGVPFMLEFEIQSKGYLIGKLVKTKHTIRASCSLLIDPKLTKLIVFKHNSCKYM